MLILKLNRIFEIFTIDDKIESCLTNLNDPSHISLQPILHYTSIDSIQNSTDDILELFRNFDTLWRTKIWNLIQDQTLIKILLITGPKASFTDSRVVSIWINSLCVLQSEMQISVTKYLEYSKDLDIADYLDHNLKFILNNLDWSPTLSSDIYTRQPNINLK